MRLLILFLVSLMSCTYADKKNPATTKDDANNQKSVMDSLSNKESKKSNKIYLSDYYYSSYYASSADSFQVTRQYLRSNQFYNFFLKDTLDSATSLYNKVHDLLDMRQKQICATKTILGNNLTLGSRIYSELLNDGLNRKSNEILDRLFKNQRIEQKCDSTTVKWIQENLGWPRSKSDMAWAFIATITNKNRNLLSYYIDNHFGPGINETIDLFEGGDYYYSYHTPIDWALSKNDTITADLLISKGAQFNKNSLIIHADSNSVEYIYNKLVSNGYDHEFLLDSSLFYSSEHGYVDKVERLLKLGADPNQRIKKSGYSPLFYTMTGGDFPSCYSVSEKFKTFKLLISMGANINLQDNKGVTPLMRSTSWACCDGCMILTAFTKYLIEHGADPNIKDNEGKTFWNYVSKNDSLNHITDNTMTPDNYIQMYDSLTAARNVDDNWVRVFVPD